ncbi:MAG: hypothetical protein V2A69_13020 [Pseudomonadota bacterium]
MKNIGKPCAGKSHARFDEGGLASPPWCGYLGTVRRKGRKQISQPKAVIASSLLYPEFHARFVNLVNYVSDSASSLPAGFNRRFQNIPLSVHFQLFCLQIIIFLSFFFVSSCKEVKNHSH